MRLPQWTFVSRAIHDRLIAELGTARHRATDAESALKRAQDGYERTCKEIGEDADRRIAAAEQRAARAEDRAVKALAEGRAALTDAFALARTAMETVSPMPGGGPRAVTPHKSVAQADREVARESREARERSGR